MASFPSVKPQQQTILGKNVRPQRLLKYEPLVLDFDQALIDRSDLAQVQLAHQTSFVDAFDQSRSLEAVDLYGRANGKVAQLISILEKWVHANGVHQGNEENEESCPAPEELPCIRKCLIRFASLVSV